MPPAGTYTLSLHDALPISPRSARHHPSAVEVEHLVGQSFAALDLVRGHEHGRSEEHTSELQSRQYLVCRLLLEKKKSMTTMSDTARPGSTFTTLPTSLAYP